MHIAPATIRTKMATAALICLPLLPACGSERFMPMQATDPGIISSSLRFHVTGPNRADNLQVAAWCDEVAARTAEILGIPLPHRQNDALIRIHLNAESETPRRIELDQYATDIGFRQTLRLEGVGQADQFDALTALCLLLLNRYALAAQDYSPKSRGPFSIPVWFSTGLASAITPSVRAIHREVLMDGFQAGIDLGIDRTFSGELDQPWLDAAQAEWFLFLAAYPNASSLFQDIIHAASLNQEITLAWIIERLPDVQNRRELAQLWDLRLVTLRHTVLATGTYSMDDLYRLKEALLIPPELLSVARGTDMRETWWLGDLIERRNESWLPGLASSLAARIRENTLGRAPALQEVAALYLEFIELLTTRDAGFFRRFQSDTRWTRQLREKLENAENALDALEKNLIEPEQEPPPPPEP